MRPSICLAVTRACHSHMLQVTLRYRVVWVFLPPARAASDNAAPGREKGFIQPPHPFGSGPDLVLSREAC